MPRGQAKKVGDRFTNANGYTYEKTEDGREAIHTLIAERRLGRKLLRGERAYFIDGDRSNIAEDNVGIKQVTDKRSPEGRLAIIEQEIADAEDRLASLKERRQDILSAIAEERSLA